MLETERLPLTRVGASIRIKYSYSDGKISCGHASAICMQFSNLRILGSLATFVQVKFYEKYAYLVSGRITETRSLELELLSFKLMFYQSPGSSNSKIQFVPGTSTGKLNGSTGNSSEELDPGTEK